MHLAPYIALVGWIPLTIYLFHRFPIRTAILFNFIAGWAILPGAKYTPTTDAFPYWILAVCLPSGYWLTKATVTGFAALAGIFLFHSRDLRSYRFNWWDLPMAAWCVIPLVSAVTGGSPLYLGLSNVAYQAISWGVPWILGRRYFRDRDSMLLVAKAIAIAGVGYIPICIVEVIKGPQLYDLIYGFQPYRWVGAKRYFGFRPTGLMEDGNQLGIWMAASALIATALFRGHLVRRLLGLPIGWVAAMLLATTIICQSVGSILLLLLMMPLVLVKRRSYLYSFLALTLFLGVAFVGLAVVNPGFLRSIAQRSGVVHSAFNVLQSNGRQSFAWRLAREQSVRTILRHQPIFGSGQWNWWQGGDQRPWGLWLLVLGMYGFAGFIALGSILYLPVARSMALFSKPLHSGESDLRRMFVALILMTALDDLLNGAMILPYLLIMGGLVTYFSPSRMSIDRAGNTRSTKVQTRIASRAS